MKILINMNNYQAFIDVPNEGNWENIDVETIIVNGFSADEAKRKAVIEAESLFSECYVWEITEDDKL